MVRGISGALSFTGLYLGRNMAIDSQLITKFSDINLKEIEESISLLENPDVKKRVTFSVFFSFVNFYISLNRN